MTKKGTFELINFVASPSIAATESTVCTSCWQLFSEIVVGTKTIDVNKGKLLYGVPDSKTQEE